MGASSGEPITSKTRSGVGLLDVLGVDAVRFREWRCGQSERNSSTPVEWHKCPGLKGVLG